MRTRSMTLAGTGFLLVTIALTGCSSSDDADSSGSGASGSSASPSSTAELVPAKAGAEEFCQVLQKQTALAQQGTLSDLTGDALTKYIAQAKELNDELVAASPVEIKKDVELTMSISDLAQQAAVDPSKRDAVIKRSTEADVQAANSRLSDYAGEACQLSSTTATAGS